MHWWSRFFFTMSLVACHAGIANCDDAVAVGLQKNWDQDHVVELVMIDDRDQWYVFTSREIDHVTGSGLAFRTGWAVLIAKVELRGLSAKEAAERLLWKNSMTFPKLGRFIMVEQGLSVIGEFKGFNAEEIIRFRTLVAARNMGREFQIVLRNKNWAVANLEVRVGNEPQCDTNRLLGTRKLQRGQQWFVIDPVIYGGLDFLPVRDNVVCYRIDANPDHPDGQWTDWKRITLTESEKEKRRAVTTRTVRPDGKTTTQFRPAQNLIEEF